jgi:hypothetical protein
MKLINNSNAGFYDFCPDSGHYQVDPSTNSKNVKNINGIGWEYKTLPFLNRHFVAIYKKNEDIYFQHDHDSWMINEGSCFKWSKKFSFLINEFQLIINDELKFKKIYFEPALMQPLNYVDFISYDQTDACADDFFYSCSLENITAWLQQVKNNWAGI